jgi:hypothetical protein
LEDDDALQKIKQQMSKPKMEQAMLMLMMNKAGDIMEMNAIAAIKYLFKRRGQMPFKFKLYDAIKTRHIYKLFNLAQQFIASQTKHRLLHNRPTANGGHARALHADDVF